MLNTIKQIPKYFSKVNYWTVGIVSAILIGLSYAIYLPSLGFYFDDWPQLYSLIVRGAKGIITYYQYDSRPFAWWPELVFFRLWGTNPILWHLTNYALRWLVAMVIFHSLLKIWPKSRQSIFWVAILFSVYPLFDQQSVAMIYTPHWMSYLAFFISIALMISATQNSKWLYFFLGLSLVANTVSLFTFEYFVGLEFIRPIILWFIFLERSKKNRIKTVFLYWLPYIVLTFVFVIWRLFLMDNLRGLSLTLVTSLIENPFSTTLQVLGFVVKDLIQIIIGVWYPALSASIIDFTSPNKLIALGLILLIFIIFVYVLQKRKKNITDQSEVQAHLKQQMFLGIAGVFFGCIPVWLIMRSYSETESVYVDRFGLAAIWGASLFIVALITYLFSYNLFRRNIILALFIALAVGKNFTDLNVYKWSTTWQNRIYSQLLWRAPGLDPSTTLLADNEFFANMGVYPTSFALNLLYPATRPMPYVDYYFLTIGKYFPTKINDLETGINIYQKRWYAIYEGDSRNSLVINWARDSVNCLWVLSSNDRFNPMISANTRVALPTSNFSRITVDGTEFQRDVNLFGKEDRNTWCYYYEKADLARQLGKWDEIVNLYEAAEAANYHPANGIELMPFIEAYARTGRADIAQNLTIQAKSLTPNLRDYMCDNWNRIAKDMQGDMVFDAEYQAYSKQDLCWEVK